MSDTHAAEVQGMPPAAEQGTPIPGEEAPSTTPPEVEVEARQMGWRPKEEFNGDPAEWRDAGEFVERGKTFLPIVQSKLRQAEERLQEYDARFEQLEANHKKQYENLSRMNEISRQRERERIERQYDDAAAQTVEFADTEKFNELQQRKKEDLKAFDEAAAATPAEEEKPAEKPSEQPEMPPELKSFMDKNGHWFGEKGNARLTHLAMAEMADIDANSPAMSLGDKLTRMETVMKQKYPKEFGLKPQGGTPDVMGGSRVATGSNSAQSNRLPAEALAQAKKEVEEGNFENIEEYAKIYFEGVEG